MSYNPTGDSFAESIELNVDANANTVTPSLDMSNARDVIFQVIGNAGLHTTHVVKLQVSLDDVNWRTTVLSVTGEGISDGSSLNIAKFARLKVTTVEGAASTVDLTMQAK